MTLEDRTKPKRSAWRAVRNQFIAGFIVMLPLGVTVFLIWWLFTTVDNLLQPVVSGIFGYRIPGVGFAAVIVIIFLAGIITSNLVGKALLRWAENYFVSRIPLVRQIYGGVKQVSEAFSVPGKSAFLGVVFVDFMQKDMKSIGFITNIRTDQTGEIIYHIYVPTVPNPTTGFLLILKEGQFTRTDISTEDAVKMVVSAGKFSPK